jgi:dolichyl-diphosphooligosaccharide--protein glycosyltransferase
VAAPGDRVQLSLPIGTSAGARHVYRREARADAAGRYRFVVPYSTNLAFSPDVHVRGLYRIAVGDRSETIDVAERAVRNGERVVGPDLSPADGST